jgi:hypothetical protein
VLHCINLWIFLMVKHETKLITLPNNYLLLKFRSISQRSDWTYWQYMRVSHEWGKNGNEITTKRTYPWSMWHIFSVMVIQVMVGKKQHLLYRLDTYI